MPPARFVSATAVLLTVFAISTLDAQEAPAEGRYPVGSALTITPAVSMVVGRDTNLIRTDGGVAGNEFYAVPQLEGWLGRGRTRINFATAWEYTSGVNTEGESQGTAFSTWNQFYSARLETAPAKVRFQALASHRNHYAPPTDFVGFEIGIRSRRIENTFQAAATFNPGGRLSYTGRATMLQLRYDADARFQGASLRNDLNRDSYAWGGSVSYAVTPLTSVAGSLEYTSDRFLYATTRDGDGFRAFGGVFFSPLAVLNGRAQVGYMRFSPKVRQGYGGPYYDIGISARIRRMFVDVAGLRNIDFSFDPARGYYVSQGLDLYTAVSATRSFDVFFRGSFRTLDPQGLLGLTESFRGINIVKVGAAYRVRQYLRIGTDLERYSYGGPGGFKGTRFTTFFVYGTERLQRLDRPLPGQF